MSKYKRKPMAKRKKRHNRSLPTCDMHLRNIPVHIYRLFKAKCARVGKPMNHRVEMLLRRDIDLDGMLREKMKQIEAEADE